MCICQLDTVSACLSEKLTLSLCMNPQIPRSNLTGKQNNQAGKELWERKKRDVYSMDRSLSMNS